VVPPVVPPPIPPVLPPPDLVPPPIIPNPVNNLASVVVVPLPRSSVPYSTGALVRSLSQQPVHTSPLISSPRSLSTLPSASSALSSAGPSIAPRVLSKKPSHTVPQSSTHHFGSPHSSLTSSSSSNTYHSMVAPWSAPPSDSIHGGLPFSSPHSPNAPPSTVPHLLTPQSSAGHISPSYSNMPPSFNSKRSTPFSSTAPSSTPYASSIRSELSSSITSRTIALSHSAPSSASQPMSTHNSVSSRGPRTFNATRSTSIHSISTHISIPTSGRSIIASQSMASQSITQSSGHSISACKRSTF
jgi:hypothetical protein